MFNVKIQKLECNVSLRLKYRDTLKASFNVRKASPLKCNEKILLIERCKPGLDTRSQFLKNK